MNKRAGPRGFIFRRGFTLLEMLVAITILVLILVLLLIVVSHVSHACERLQGQKVRQQTARQVLEVMSRDLETAIFPLDVSSQTSFQFVLNPSGLDASYECVDAAFWQASAIGSTSAGDVFSVGYFVKWSNTTAGTARCEIRRLLVPPSDDSSIFKNPTDWINPSVISRLAPGSDDPASQRGLLAENVIGLWILLKDNHGNSISPPYDSRTALATSTNHVASAVIELVLIDPQTLAQMPQSDLSKIASLYPGKATAENFVAVLSQPTQAGVEIFKTSVSLEAAPQ